MLGQTKRLRILDGSTTNRAAERPSASRKGVCHDRMGYAQGGQDVFRQGGGQRFQAHSTGPGPDGARLSLGPSSALFEDDRRRGVGHRCHVATISRRLLNPQWRTRDWYVGLYDGLLGEVNRWERRQAPADGGNGSWPSTRLTIRRCRSRWRTALSWRGGRTRHARRPINMPS